VAGLQGQDPGEAPNNWGNMPHTPPYVQLIITSAGLCTCCH